MNNTRLTNAEALSLWHGVYVELVRSSGLDISSRQLALMLTVYLSPPPHTVRGLASELEIAKPVITRALDSLGQRGLLKRVRDESDRRSVLVERTTEGTAFLSTLSDLIVAASGGKNS